ncbi:hypothetical protein P6U16_22575 (plasmid) [Rhizobium sp. 32-5/1]|uniref:hypothetical protein n=1 Tax=Rhizobium sp. 32-5/1 TaxID=3019602 RepID=UPI00240D8F69|nr:hypothetical protein [Rhizobium sp. 32-5/1]WEZ85806.1 hypothetical protein P6U16_22575 [Rhizobium sp. 32-5/1]
MTEMASRTSTVDLVSQRRDRPAAQSSAPRNLRLLKALLETPAVGKTSQPEHSPEIGVGLEPKRGWISRLKTRHTVIGAAFLALVAVPSTGTSLYMAFVAADQYHSSVSFSVRSIDSAQPADLLGMFSQSSTGNTVSDSYVLLDYILSERMVQMVDEAFGLETILRRAAATFSLVSNEISRSKINSIIGAAW